MAPDSLKDRIYSKINELKQPYDDLVSLYEGKWETNFNQGSYTPQVFRVFGKTFTINICDTLSPLAPIFQFLATLLCYVIAFRIFFGGIK